MTLPSFEDILTAHREIAERIHQTPVMTCRTLDSMCGCRLFFKCENLQKIGAFKIRGAAVAVARLSEAEAARGVVTHSSGNHGAALALAARWRGIAVHVVMPEDTPRIKQAAVAGYGARVVLCPPTYDGRETALAAVRRDTGATFVHPFNHPDVICGQGTAALELCRTVTDLDVVIAPVGGGGLLSGTAIAVTGQSPATRIVGAEPEAANDAWQSLRAGRIRTIAQAPTIADGLRSAAIGNLAFHVFQRHVDDILLAGEAQIVTAMRHLWERMKLVVEPSAAVPLAALMAAGTRFAGQRVGVILSGGNVDLDRLPWQAPA